jgi:hypothetical protein
MSSEDSSIKLIAAPPELMTAVQIAALGFDKDESNALIEDVEYHLHSGRLVYRIFSGDNEVGFAIFAIYGDILYLSGIIIIPAYQGIKISHRVVEQVRQLYPQCRYLALRTQSLRMYLAASRMCEISYPQLDDSNIPTEFEIRGMLVAKAIGSDFPIHLACYGGPLYGKKPVCSDRLLQIQWDTLCNFERGDAVLFIGSFL